MRTLKFHLSHYLKNISQSFFLNNAFFGFGLLLLLGFFSPDLLICSLAASLLGYAYSVRRSTPKILRDCGLITINGFFFGIAMASLYEQNAQFYMVLVLGAAAIPLITKAAYEVLQHWRLSPLIIPYILVLWVIELSRSAVVLNHLSDYSASEMHFLDPVLMNMGRLLFLPNPFFGLSLLLLIALFSPRRALFFFLGTAVACTVTFFMAATGHDEFSGQFYCYSAGLIGLGLASSPEKFSVKTILLFCVVSSFLTIAADELLKGQRLPTLSLPYVITFWVALLSRVPRLSISWAPSMSMPTPLLRGPEDEKQHRL